jgi:hypothetical protein
MKRANKASTPKLPAELTDGALLSRGQAALWLSANGFPIATHRLAIMATTGAGPRYCIILGKARYTVTNLRAWVAELTATTFTSAADRFAYKRRTQLRENKAPQRTREPAATKAIKEGRFSTDDISLLPKTREELFSKHVNPPPGCNQPCERIKDQNNKRRKKQKSVWNQPAEGWRRFFNKYVRVNECGGIRSRGQT